MRGLEKTESTKSEFVCFEADLFFVRVLRME